MTQQEGAPGTTSEAVETSGTIPLYRCSFCRKTRDRVRRLIAGPDGVFICNECVDLCNKILAEAEAQPATS